MGGYVYKCYRCMCSHMCVQVQCIFVHVYVCTCLYRCMCVKYVCVFLCVYVCTDTYICTYVYMCIQVHICVHVYTGCAWRLEADIRNHPQMLFCLTQQGKVSQGVCQYVSSCQPFCSRNFLFPQSLELQEGCKTYPAYPQVPQIQTLVPRLI